MIVLFLFWAASIASVYVAIKTGAKSLQLPLGIYLGAYLLTTVIGATIISFEHGSIVWQLGSGNLDPSYIRDYNSVFYWGMLYGPFIIPPLTCALLQKISFVGVRLKPSTGEGTTIGLLAYWLVVLGTASVCAFRLASAGYLRPDIVWRVEGDYETMLVLRAAAINVLHAPLAAAICVGLPALAQVASYQTIKRRSYAWGISLITTVILTCVLLLCTIMKAPCLIFLGSIIIGIGKLTKKTLWLLGLAGMVIFFVLTALQSYLTGAWTAFRSLYLLIFRMADPFPYYLNLYPRFLPFTGLDFGLDIIGLAPHTSRPQDVMDRMYGWGGAVVQGAAPAAAHVDAYAQAGIWLALLTLVLIGVVIKGISMLGDADDSPFRHAIFMQGVVGAYFLSQTSLRDFLIASYGILWLFVYLGILLIVSRMLASFWRRALTGGGDGYMSALPYRNEHLSIERSF